MNEIKYHMEDRPAPTKGQRVAMRAMTGSGNGEVVYLSGDDLGSVSLATDHNGNLVSQARYAPYGQGRWSGDTVMPTKYAFTGQRADSFGLMDYHARFYSLQLGRFISADTLILNLGSAMDFDRYMYSAGNPLPYTDPTGHGYCDSIYAIPEECEDKSNSLPPSPPPVNYINPWSEPPWQWLGIDPEAWLRQNNLAMDDIFLGGLRDPLHAGNSSDAYSEFGGCNTIRNCESNSGHPATDAIGDPGTHIYSAGYGVVVVVGEMDPGFGNYVVIQHNVYGVIYYTVYAHLKETNILVGDIVDQNSLIGTMGHSGQKNGSDHLHFEARTSKGIDLKLIKSTGHPFNGASCSDDVSCGRYWPHNLDELKTYWVD